MLKQAAKDFEFNLKKAYFTGDTIINVLTAQAACFLLKTCDIVAVPQRRASWGIPALEAIQSGVAVVISDGDGASELVKISGAARVFKSGDWLSLYSALHDLLNNTVNLREAKESAILFAKKIHPTTMAEYLNKVLIYVEGASTKKPSVPWLESFF